MPRKATVRLVRGQPVNGDMSAEVEPDLFGKLPGRGVHLCPDVACFEKAARQQSFSRAFRKPTTLSDSAGLAGRFLEASVGQVKALFR